MEELIQKKPIDYLKIAFRRKWLVIIPTIFGIIFGLVAANTLPKVYESSTLMLVEEGRIINPLFKGLAVSTSVAQRITVLKEQMLGWDRINQLISKLNLSRDIKTQKEFEGLVKTLRNAIKVKLYGQNIIRISHQGDDPVDSMNIVKTVTDIFIAENLRQQNRETENAISFINDQLVLYQKQLKQSEVAAMEERLDNMLLDSTEKHPIVIDLRKQIAAARAEVEKGDYTLETKTGDGQNTELAALKEEIKGMREELNTSSLDAQRGGQNRVKFATATNEKLYKLLLLERVEKVSAEDITVNQRLYNELLQRLETAKITQRLEASREGTRYVILDPARLPLTPIKPNKLFVLFAGLCFGLCVGLGLVFAVEVLDHSFLGIEDAKANLELPMLGGIPKIITQRDLKAQKIRNVRVAALSVLVGATLAIFIVFNVILGS